MLATLLIFPQLTLKPAHANIDPKFIQLIPEITIPVPDFDQEVLAPLRARQEEARKEAERLEALRVASLPPPVVYTAPLVQRLVAPPVASGELTGSYGHAIGGNCVNEIPMGLRGSGNPISWQATSAPYIGGAALWYSNHVGRIVGFWSNGDIEIAHQGWYGAPVTRFPRSTFRGFR